MNEGTCDLLHTARRWFMIGLKSFRTIIVLDMYSTIWYIYIALLDMIHVQYRLLLILLNKQRLQSVDVCSSKKYTRVVCQNALFKVAISYVRNWKWCSWLFYTNKHQTHLENVIKLAWRLFQWHFQTVVKCYCSFHIRLSKDFWRKLFYYFLFPAETFMMCVNVLYSQKQNFSWIGQKMRNFPVDPYCKNRSLW